MKILASSTLLLSCAALAAAQGAKGSSAQAGGEKAQAPSFIAGRQMNILCVHKHDAGDVGSTILYKAVELDADKLSGSIHVGRLTAIVVRFTQVNTLCYNYNAGVTKEIAFYGSSAPQQLKNFFVGVVPAVFIPAGAADDFTKAQGAFKSHFDSYGSLGLLTVQIRKAFSDAIDPKKINSQIREDLRVNLRRTFGYNDRDVTKEDLTVRQAELEAGLKILADDLAKLRAAATPTDPTQMALISGDEEAVSALTGQCDNYATAITDLENVQNSPDVVEKIVTLEKSYDEYEVTAAVTMISAKPTESSVAATATSSSSVIVDITGVAGLDFSTGLVASHPVTHDYFLKVSGATKTIMDGGARDPGFFPAAFVSYYVRPAPGQIAFGPAFGVDISSGQNFFFGIALTRAGAQRFSLVGGFALNKLNLLNGDKVGQPPINGSSIQYKSRYVGGYFFGATFDLGG